MSSERVRLEPSVPFQRSGAHDVFHSSVFDCGANVMAGGRQGACTARWVREVCRWRLRRWYEPLVGSRPTQYFSAVRGLNRGPTHPCPHGAHQSSPTTIRLTRYDPPVSTWSARPHRHQAGRPGRRRERRPTRVHVERSGHCPRAQTWRGTHPCPRGVCPGKTFVPTHPCPRGAHTS